MTVAPENELSPNFIPVHSNDLYPFQSNILVLVQHAHWIALSRSITDRTIYGYALQFHKLSNELRL